MKCNEVKNIIRETSNLDCIHADKEIQAHLKTCSSCMNSFLYEEKLRSGFRQMVEQKPPAEVEAGFMTALQQEIEQEKEQQVGWFASLSGLFAAFHFKTALASCLVGFFAAILLQQTGHIQEGYSAKQNSSSSVAKTSELLKKQSPEIGLTESDDSMIALQKSSKGIQKTDEVKRQRIQKMVLKESEPILKMPENQFSENISTRMMAKKETPAKKSRAAPVTAMFRSSAPSASAPEADSFAPEGQQQNLSEKAAPDPRIAELEKLIDNYALELEAGPFDIKSLAVKGIIPAEKLDYFDPPAGMTWFVQKKENHTKVILKKD